MIAQEHETWLKKRALDPDIAADCGLRTVEREGKPWLALPYRERGQTVNHKYRQTSEKDHRMDTGAPLLLWNADALTHSAVRSGAAPLIITEGEWDALAVIQSGILHVTSVPAGAPQQVTENLDEAKRYEWVDRHADDLRKVQRFVLATDADEAGQFLRSDLVALLGADRCDFVQYPDGCKDLNDVLREHGAEAVRSAIANAKPVPVRGLYTIDDFPERGEIGSFSIGIPALSEHIKLVPGTLTVVTGWPGMGKSTMMDAIIASTIQHHFAACVASFESDVKPIMEEALLCSMLQCSKNELSRHPDYERAYDTLRKRLTIISQNVDEDLEMDLDYYLKCCRVAVLKHGARLIVLDPWNEIEHKRKPQESETEYIGRAIRRMRRFAKKHDVCFFVVAHPAKPAQGDHKPPSLSSISGSQNWHNKPDYGLIYHRPKRMKNLAMVRVAKVRKGYPGKEGQVMVTFDHRCSQLVEADDFAADEEQ